MKKASIVHNFISLILVHRKLLAGIYTIVMAWLVTCIEQELQKHFAFSWNGGVGNF